MRHKHYHEIEGSGPVEIGHALGTLFGKKMRQYIAACRSDDDWPEQQRQALGLLNPTKTIFPELIDELSAYANAAGVELLDLWTVAIEDELSTQLPERCTTIVTNGGRLIAHNEDWSEDATKEICLLKKRVGNHTSLQLYYYACPLGGVALSISSQGHIHAINSVDHPVARFGIPKSVIARVLSQERLAPKGLYDVLANPRSSGFAHTIVDQSGVTSVECTAEQFRVTIPELPFVHTNHFLNDTLCQQDPMNESRSSRCRFSDAGAKVAKGMDLQSMMDLVSDRSRGRRNSIFNDQTIARAIIDLDRLKAHFWLKREKRKGWIAYPIDFVLAHRD